MIRPALLVALAAAPLAAQSFEGTIAMTMSSSGQSMPMTVHFKQGKMRYEMAGPRGSMVMVMDPESKKMLMIMAEQRMVMEMNMDEAAAMAQRMGGAGRGEAGPAPTITKTGRTETIAGYKCEHVTVTTPEGAVDACFSTDVGATFQMPSGGMMGRGAQPRWASSLGAGGFPLKVSMNGQVMLEVTGIEKKALDASLFVAPEGFTKMAMPGRP